jgi:hypothetical protein
MGPEDEHVIHIAKLADGLVVCHLQSRFFRVPHEEVGNDGIVSMPLVCS